eukprot:6195493-Pleurochrysis_carterae.AAC.5
MRQRTEAKARARRELTLRMEEACAWRLVGEGEGRARARLGSQLTEIEITGARSPSVRRRRAQIWRSRSVAPDAPAARHARE